LEVKLEHDIRKCRFSSSHLLFILLYKSTGFELFFSRPAFVFKLPIILLIDDVLEVIGGGGGGAYGGGTDKDPLDPTALLDRWKNDNLSVLLPGFGEGAGEASMKGIDSSSKSAFFGLYPFISTGSGTPFVVGGFSFLIFLLLLQ
jgi:hypothetical protein